MYLHRDLFLFRDCRRDYFKNVNNSTDWKYVFDNI